MNQQERPSIRAQSYMILRYAEFYIKNHELVFEVMGFVNTIMEFVLTIMDCALKMIILHLKMMNLTLKMMNFVHDTQSAVGF